MPKVTLVFKFVHRFRAPFLEHLRALLAEDGIELDIVFGEPGADEATKANHYLPGWGHHVPNREIRLAGRTLLWQPVWKLVKDSDLVVVEQANKLLLNPALLAAQALGGPRVALWGHGRNLQATRADWFSERVKRLLVKPAHWFFAYTEQSKQIVGSLGFPPDHVTVVQNAVDSTSLSRAREELTPAKLEQLGAELGLGAGPRAVFIGGVYDLKRPDFLVAAADEVRARLPGFELLVIGGGERLDVFEEAARTRPWLRLLGPRFGADMVAHARLGELILMPGLVGLVIVDSFALELPMVATDVAYHSPEIEYLDHGVNGIMLAADTTPQDYGAEVAGLLADAERLETLRQGCRHAAATYTIEAMAENFAGGLRAALEAS